MEKSKMADQLKASRKGKKSDLTREIKVTVHFDGTPSE